MNKMTLNIQRFAVSKSTSFNEPSLTDAMITGNYSTLSITVYFSPNNSVTWFGSATLTCICNNVPQTAKVSLSKGGSVSKTFTFTNISHNADGSKSVSWSWSCPTGTDVLKTVSASGTRTLQTIPRASEPTLSTYNTDLGTTITITTNRVSENFTHTLTYQFGEAIGIISNGITESTTWTPALSLANQIPNSPSGNATITCSTYNGGTLIGSKDVTVTLNVPSTVIPTVSIGTLTEANTAMQTLNWGVFVQNKSQLNIPITAAGIYNSTIQSIVTTINGLSFTGTPVITSTLITTGTNTISTTVTDTRGRTATTTKTYTVVAYSNPQLTTATAVRSLQDGTESDEGTYLKYSFTGSISPVSNHNAHTFRIGYKTVDGSTYTYTNIDTTNYSINKVDQVLNLNLDTNSSYDIIFEVSDTFATSSIKRDISSGFDLMNFNASGKSMAIGKVSEAGSNEETFEINMDTDIVEGNLKMKGTSILQKNNNGATFIGSDEHNIVLRPNGVSNSSGQTYIDTNGNMSVDGNISSTGNISATGNITTDGNITADGSITADDITGTNISGTNGSFNSLSINNDLLDLKDISSEIDFTGGVSYVNSQFRKFGNMILISYQSEAKRFAVNETLFTMPAEYLPTSQVFAVCTLNANAYGIVSISGTTGVCTINQLSSTPSSNTRIYFQIIYFIK